MACGHQGGGNSRSREDDVDDQFVHQQFPPAVTHLKRVSDS